MITIPKTGSFASELLYEHSRPVEAHHHHHMSMLDPADALEGAVQDVSVVFLSMQKGKYKVSPNSINPMPAAFRILGTFSAFSPFSLD